MKTVFRVGMEVYDNIFFPNSKGEVVRIDKHIDCERVIVWTMNFHIQKKGD